MLMARRSVGGSGAGNGREREMECLLRSGHSKLFISEAPGLRGSLFGSMRLKRKLHKLAQTFYFHFISFPAKNDNYEHF